MARTNKAPAGSPAAQRVLQADPAPKRGQAERKGREEEKVRISPAKTDGKGCAASPSLGRVTLLCAPGAWPPSRAIGLPLAPLQAAHMVSVLPHQTSLVTGFILPPIHPLPFAPVAQRSCRIPRGWRAAVAAGVGKGWGAAGWLKLSLFYPPAPAQCRMPSADTLHSL